MVNMTMTDFVEYRDNAQRCSLTTRVVLHYDGQRREPSECLINRREQGQKAVSMSDNLQWLVSGWPMTGQWLVNDWSVVGH